MVDIRDLLSYNDLERRAFFNSFSNLSWEEFTKDRQASFGSIRNIFIHSLNATDYWLTLLQNSEHLQKKKFEEYESLSEVGDLMERVEKRLRNYLNTMSPEELKKLHQVEATGKPEELTTEDILVHIFEEEVHHRGELIALFWQMGIEPPVIGYPP